VSVAAAKSTVERYQDVLELRPYAGRDLLLLRPDGYVAFESSAAASALVALEEVLRRQVRVVS
jgi:hypothetical protein